MAKYNLLSFYPAVMFFELFFISFFLQISLGFSSFEDEYPAGEPGFYPYLDDWRILRKVPRGYMVPIPRVGRRQITEHKRQNMIPQPRIGRELELDDQLAEILFEIQNLLADNGLPYSHQRMTSAVEALKNEYPAIHDDIMANHIKNSPERNRKSIISNKDSTSGEESDDNSRIADEDSAMTQTLRNDNNNDVSFLPKKGEDALSSDSKDSGFDIFDEDQQTRLLPLPHVDRPRTVNAVAEKSLAGGLLAYPRLGRELELYESLVPYPRLGRLVVDPETLRYSIILNPDDSVADLEGSRNDDYVSSKSVMKKKHNIKFIPRIGRKKRSISDEEEKKELETSKKNVKEVEDSEHNQVVWDHLDDPADDYFLNEDKRSFRTKNAFVPRIGKKWYDLLNDYEEKRARTFTPRIGRAALIPRIGRSDLRYRLKSRASFVPRIGRRAALIPRIGRSESERTAKDDAN